MCSATVLEIIQCIEHLTPSRLGGPYVQPQKAGRATHMRHWAANVYVLGCASGTKTKPLKPLFQRKHWFPIMTVSHNGHVIADPSRPPGYRADGKWVDSIYTTSESIQ